MKLMTCCSCDRSPGPRLLSAAAVGAHRSAAGQTRRRSESVYFGRWFGARHPVYSPTNLYASSPPPPASHARYTHINNSLLHTQPACFYLATAEKPMAPDSLVQVLLNNYVTHCTKEEKKNHFS